MSDQPQNNGTLKGEPAAAGPGVKFGPSVTLQPAPVPAHWRRFRFRFNFLNTDTGKAGGGAGEVVALNYTAALIKLLGTLNDNPGRMLSLGFEDITDQRIITRK